ncbi:MAG TPA: FkbM family methyltransferase [Solirubrobacteraceae bacterium]|jgi:FkbM family methyltransferase|nr:FkbM family methyltransferase [Solirubrobacteraceae bacterium]
MSGEHVRGRPDRLSVAAQRRLRAVSTRLGIRGALGRSALPVLAGYGRGLRVRVGASNIRVASPGEPVLERTVLDLLSPGDVFYDLGANIGWYSLLAARKVGPEGCVVAFEPLLRNAFYAQRNANTNRLHNITVIPAAVSDRDGWLSFFMAGSLMGRLDKDDFEGQARHRAKQDRSGGRHALVPVVALDSWLAQTGQRPPRIVKIDVEGAEVGVLKGMRETIAAVRPILIVELHGTRERLADELEAIGYEHRLIESDLPTREGGEYGLHVLAKPMPVA